MNEYILSANNKDAPTNWMEEIGLNQNVVSISNTMTLLLIKCPEKISKKLEKEFAYLKFEYVCPQFIDELK